jgi:hypothetical protein
MQTTLTTPAQGNTTKSNYIDFITYGTGLVTRARFVNGRKLKTPALYCTIAVPLDERGAANGRWTNFDVRVLGNENIRLIEDMMPAVLAGKRPRVHFSIGDAYADPYWKKSGDEQLPRAQFKGRLLRVSLAKDEPQRELLSYGLAYINAVNHARSRTDLCVIHGDTSGQETLEHSYIGCSLPMTPEAQMASAINTVIAGTSSNAKVLVSVVLRDLHCSAFVFRDESRHAGQLGTNVNAVLHSVRWVKVEGQKVYELPKAEPQAPVPAAPVIAEPAPQAEDEQFISSFVQAYPDDDDDEFAELFED